MRRIAIGLLCVGFACGKGSSGGEGKSGDPRAGAPNAKAGSESACKPMTGLCKRFPADELVKLFEVPGIAATGEDHDDGRRPVDDCNYTTSPGPDGGVPLAILLRYQCFAGGEAAAADYKMTHDGIATTGQPLESVPGLGAEAYWTYSGSDKGIIQGHLRARNGNVVVQLDYGSYKLDGKQVVPTIAKQRAIDMITRVLAKLP